ncbi:unnamed protein product, partial [Polarella glacialis]
MRGGPSVGVSRGLGRRGHRVPCAAAAATRYVPQEICCVASSPDGRILAASCSSGQVYIWRCAPDEWGGGVRLHGAVLTLSGWLGPEQVLALDFCHAGPSAEVSGVSGGGSAVPLLLVCLLSGGRLRLLDPSDGRCVAVTQPLRAASAGAPRNALAGLLQVLEDGRHVAIRSGSDVVVLDLWSGKVVTALPVPHEAQLTRLAVPRFPASTSELSGRDFLLRLAAHSAQELFVWGLPLPVARAAGGERPAPLFTYSFAPSRGNNPFDRASPGTRSAEATSATALAFEAGVLLLVLPERLLLWAGLDSSSGAPWAPGPPIQVDRVQGVEPLRGLLGAALISTAARSSSPVAALDSSRKSQGGQNSLHGRPSRARSCPALLCKSNAASSDGREAGGENSPGLVLIAWTAAGQMYSFAVDEKTGNASSPVLPWGSMPVGARADTCSWWYFSPLGLIVGAVLGPSGDALHLSSSAVSSERRSRWVRAADLEDLWRPPVGAGPAGACSVACATFVEAQGFCWLALGLTSGQEGRCVACDGQVSVAVANSAPSEGEGNGGVAPEAQQLKMPKDFGEPSSLTGLGTRFLAAGSSRGVVCWWATSDWRLSGTSLPAYRAPILHLARVWSHRLNESALVAEPVILAALDELGKCRLIDAALGEVLCVLQSQCSGPSLWLDTPVRFTYDAAGHWITAATPTRAWTWDSSSGAFESSASVAGERGEGGEAARRDQQGT